MYLKALGEVSAQNNYCRPNIKLRQDTFQWYPRMVFILGGSFVPAIWSFWHLCGSPSWSISLLPLFVWRGIPKIPQNSTYRFRINIGDCISKILKNNNPVSTVVFHRSSHLSTLNNHVLSIRKQKLNYTSFAKKSYIPPVHASRYASPIPKYMLGKTWAYPQHHPHHPHLLLLSS